MIPPDCYYAGALITLTNGSNTVVRAIDPPTITSVTGNNVPFALSVGLTLGLVPTLSSINTVTLVNGSPVVLTGTTFTCSDGYTAETTPTYGDTIKIS